MTAYQDRAGKWTIGYGQTGPTIVKGLTITLEQAETLLRAAVLKFEAEVRARVRVPLRDTQWAALISFVYNVGVTNFSTSTMLKLINAGATDLVVAAEFPKWNKVTVDGVKVDDKGLSNRRVPERAMWLS